MEFCQYVFEAMKMIIVISAVMVLWFGVIACLKWIWKNWFLIAVIVTWNVIASLGWIWKSRFSYMVETPEPISEDNQEPVDVDVSASLPSSSAELTAHPTWKHDVFLSFRGVDTRKNITFFLYNRLQERGIKTFMDERDFEVGDAISPTLLTAVEESRLAIIVLSQNYASSPWCLEELRNIFECMEGDQSDDNRILPLFYNVHPSDVRHQTSRFGDAFTKLKKSGRHESAKVVQWIDTLTKVAQISGWHSLEFKNDGELLNNIVEAVCKKLLPTESVLKIPLGDFEEFAATKEAIHEVMKALKDGEATTIGVYGMGGVGKTTMVKHVGVQAQEEKLFNKVIMAVVSQKPDLKEIQQEFAETLGFELKEKTEMVRALKLKKKIMSQTRILVILDDIWKRIDFSRIGIPSDNELQKCNSKVLLTTRSLKLCRMMGTHAKIPLNILSEEDSWRLFVREAGMSSDKSSNFSDVASKVARECAGLPVALIAVARALRDEDLDRWEEAARQLKASQPPIREDEGDVFACIKLSYDHLKSDDSKSCFLLCCLFPEDYNIPIEYLVMYGIGKGMFQDLTMQRARDSTYSVVQDLKDSSLLLGGRDDGCVRMHDVIRDTAIRISSSEDGQQSLVKVGCELTNWPKMDAHKGYSAISLMKNKICKLQKELVCPNLQILLLRQNPSLNAIPESFFQSQNELRVLDLSDTRISLLQSIGFLTNLQALYLDYCRNIFDTSVIGKLHKLEILSMRGTALKELSREIEQLTNLRMLDISAAALSLRGSICKIPSKVISKLHKLEELYMQYAFWDWGRKIDGEGEETNIGFDELAGLSYLRILKVCILDANCIPKSVEVEPNWDYFDISICSGKSGQGIYNILRSGNNYRSLSLDSTDTTMGTFPDWFVNAVVKNTERLRYEECKCLSNILVEYDRGKLHGLKVLSVKGRCENLKELMNAITCVPDPDMPVFEKLEELYLEYLDDLKQLCVGELPPRSLCNLKLLKVACCHNLRNLLLPSKLLQKLPNLEILNCEESKVDHVFECKGFEPDQTNLREMELRDLDVIRSICNGPAPRRMFQALKQLVIHNCNFQGSLFTFDVAQCLFQLESLVVSECLVLERVIEARRETLHNKTVLPKLKNLCLQYLPMLYKGSATVDFECPSLENLHLIGCPHLSFQSPASDYFHSRNPVNEDWSPFLRFKYAAGS